MCSRRNKGFMQAFFIVLIIGGCTYAIYFYHTLNLKLSNSEKLLERYRKQHESLQSQLKVVYDHRAKLEKSLQKEKGEHKKTKQVKEESQQDHEIVLQRTKHEASNRFNALDTEHKMLNAKYENLELEHNRLQQQHLRAVQDHQNTLNAVQQNNHKLRQDLDNAKRGWSDSYNKLNKRKEDLEQSLRSYQEQVQNKLTDYEKSKQEHLKVINILKTQVSEQKKQVDFYQNDSNNLRLQLNKKQANKLDDISHQQQPITVPKVPTQREVNPRSLQAEQRAVKTERQMEPERVRREIVSPVVTPEKVPTSNIPTQNNNIVHQPKSQNIEDDFQDALHGQETTTDHRAWTDYNEQNAGLGGAPRDSIDDYKKEQARRLPDFDPQLDHFRKEQLIGQAGNAGDDINDHADTGRQAGKNNFDGRFIHENWKDDLKEGANTDVGFDDDDKNEMRVAEENVAKSRQEYLQSQNQMEMEMKRDSYNGNDPPQSDQDQRTLNHPDLHAADAPQNEDEGENIADKNNEDIGAAGNTDVQQENAETRQKDVGGVNAGDVIGEESHVGQNMNSETENKPKQETKTRVKKDSSETKKKRSKSSKSSHGKKKKRSRSKVQL